MKFYTTKYALTEGIGEVEGIDPAKTEWPNMLVDRSTQYTSHYHGEGKEWHRTREKATERANVLRLKKIRSLKKQIKKLESLKFQ